MTQAEKIRTILKHAKQGVTDPRFARDQCALIVELCESDLLLYLEDTHNCNGECGCNCGRSYVDGSAIIARLGMHSPECKHREAR